MKPLRIRIDRIIDFGTIVSLVGIDIETAKPVTVHVDHRPFAAFWEAWRDAGFPPRVSHTVRSQNDWDRQLLEVRRRGFAVSVSESFDNLASIAVPILDPGRRAVSAVSLLGPSAEIVPEVERLARHVQEAARGISRAMPR